MVCAITCHFNWCDYQRPKANLRRFQRQMVRDGVPLYGVEAHLKHQEPVTKGWPGWRQICVPRHAVMFQKEALLNAAEKDVPDSYNKIAWVDADVEFENANWMQDTSAKLEEYEVVQPFAEAVWTGPGGEEIRRIPSCGALMQDGDGFVGHPGFAFAARRELWSEHGGLFPWAVTGRGDSIAAAAFLGAKLSPLQLNSLGDTLASHLEWKLWTESISLWTRGKVSHVAGRIFHNYHGSLQDRKYTERHDFVSGLEIPRDLYLTDAGHVQWTDEADPVVMAGVAQYFKDRNEDA